MFDLRPVFYVLGRILFALALLMIIPALFDWSEGHPNAAAFAGAALITGFVGLTVGLATRNAVGNALDVRQAYLLTAAIWCLVPAFGALPLYMGAPHLSYLHAYFEATSGLTTTGATVIIGLEHLPYGVNLWRGMMNWIGGLGIAFVAMIFLPLMRMGGMQFFRTEGFDTFGKALPRATDIARQLMAIYAALTVIAIMVFSIVGMPAEVALVHGLTIVSTGGFSLTDQSFSDYAGAGEYAGTLFMILGSLPFVRYVQLVNGQAKPIWQDAQIRAYLGLLLFAVLLVALWRVFTSDMAFEPAFRESLFNLTSIISSTGAFSGSFSNWGGFAILVGFVLGIVGACSGSTAAGISVFRMQIALAVLRRQIRQIGQPSSVDPIKYEGRRVEEDVINAVMMFISSYLAILGLLSVAMTLFDVDIVSAVFAVWTSLGNVGYGIGPMVLAGSDSFIAFPDGAIVIMILAMIMGRLGLLAIMVLILPAFWRR